TSGAPTQPCRGSCADSWVSVAASRFLVFLILALDAMLVNVVNGALRLREMDVGFQLRAQVRQELAAALVEPQRNLAFPLAVTLLVPNPERVRLLRCLLVNFLIVGLELGDIFLLRFQAVDR